MHAVDPPTPAEIWRREKAKHPDVLLLIPSRLFLNAFDDDAHTLAAATGLPVITANGYPMCGIPRYVREVDTWLDKIKAAGLVIHVLPDRHPGQVRGDVPQARRRGRPRKGGA